MNKAEISIELIEDPKRIEKFTRWVRLVAEREYDLRLDQIRINGWVVVPTPDDTDGEYEANVIAALKSLGVTTVFVTSVIGISDGIVGPIYEVSVSAGFLRAVTTNSNIFFGGIIIGAETPSFAILYGDCSTLISGPPAFVESAVGGDLAKARDEWHEYAYESNDPLWVKNFQYYDRKYNQR